jgi:hypothetical protein
MQPGNPPDNDPYGPPPSPDPTAEQYGQPQQPYGQPPPQQPYAQPPPQQPYGQAPPQQPYGQPTEPAGYGTPAPGYPAAPGAYGTPPPQQNNTIGLLGMIFGIVGIPAACCAFLGFLLGAAGIVLGVLGMKRVSEGTASNRGMALAGVICGAVAVVLSIISGAIGFVSGFPVE